MGKEKKGRRSKGAPDVSPPGGTAPHCDPVVGANHPLWGRKIEMVVAENPEAADSLAQVFQILKEALESGPEGVARAGWLLSDGIRLAYENTETHQKALYLYCLHLAGRLQSGDEPLELIGAAIARADPS
jgi:hypothetical protein